MGSAAALVLSPQDIPQFLQVGAYGRVMIGPIRIALQFGLKAPPALSFHSADLALLAILGAVRPGMLVSHGPY